MNTDDGSEEEEEDRLIGGSVTRSHSSPVLLRVLTILSCLGGFLFGYDTGVVSGAMLLVSQHFALTPAWHSAIVSVTVIMQKNNQKLKQKMRHVMHFRQ